MSIEPVREPLSTFVKLFGPKYSFVYSLVSSVVERLWFEVGVDTSIGSVYLFEVIYKLIKVFYITFIMSMDPVLETADKSFNWISLYTEPDIV